MPSRRASRVLAAIAAMVLAVSSASAAVSVPGPAARNCCKTRCGHDTPSFQACCCASPASPAAGARLSEAQPVSFVSTPGPTPLIAHVAAPAACSPATHAPPGCPLFLQRCTLVL